MQINTIIVISLIISIVYFLINSIMTAEIIAWVKPKKRVISLLLLLWLVPFVGAYLIHQKDDISPIWNYKPNSVSNAGVQVSSCFLAIDVIFNPAAKHLIELVEQENKLTMHLYETKKKKDFSIIKVEL